MTKPRRYDFPNAVIVVRPDRKCFTIYKWFPHRAISRTREWTAGALLELRKFRRGERKETP